MGLSRNDFRVFGICWGVASLSDRTRLRRECSGAMQVPHDTQRNAIQRAFEMLGVRGLPSTEHGKWGSPQWGRLHKRRKLVEGSFNLGSESILGIPRMGDLVLDPTSIGGIGFFRVAREP